MTITASLHSTVAELIADKKSEEFLYVYAESVLYLAGALSAFDYQHNIKPYCKVKSAKFFRRSIQDQKYTNLNLKLFAIRLAQLRSPSRGDAFQLAAEFQIRSNDATLIYIFFSENDWFRRELKVAGKRVEKGNALLELKEIEGLFHRIFPSILKYIKFISYSKLRFIVKAENEGFEDLYSELSTKVLQAYYSLIPAAATEAHIVNYLKRAVHNHAMNLIKSHTSQKRGRIINTGVDRNQQNQFSLLCVSQNQVGVTLDEDGSPVDILAVANDANEKFELQYCVSEVLDSVKYSKKKYRFVSLLLGTEDAEFSEWLRREKLSKPNEDNVDVQARTSAKDFNTYVADFLNVSYRTADAFLGSLREMVEA